MLFKEGSSREVVEADPDVHLELDEKGIPSRLADEFNATSEFLECFEACEHRAKRFFVALYLLSKVEGKVSVFNYGRKTYLELVEKMKPIIQYEFPWKEPIQVLDVELLQSLVVIHNPLPCRMLQICSF